MLIPRPAALGYMKDFPGWQFRVVIKLSMHALLTVFLPPPAKRVGKQRRNFSGRACHSACAMDHGSHTASSLAAMPLKTKSPKEKER
jgi:hypothetical protein